MEVRVSIHTDLTAKGRPAKCLPTKNDNRPQHYTSGHPSGKEAARMTGDLDHLLVQMRQTALYDGGGEASDIPERAEVAILALVAKAAATDEENARLRALLKGCADGLERSVNQKYPLPEREIDPTSVAKHALDMAPVWAARATLAPAVDVRAKAAAADAGLRVGPGRSQQFRDGHRNATKACVAWLHARTDEMNDWNAKAVLNTAAFHLGNATRGNKGRAD
jgi:hypothetical protein